MNRGNQEASVKSVSKQTFKTHSVQNLKAKSSPQMGFVWTSVDSSIAYKNWGCQPHQKIGRFCIFKKSRFLTSLNQNLWPSPGPPFLLAAISLFIGYALSCLPQPGLWPSPGPAFLLAAISLFIVYALSCLPQPGPLTCLPSAEAWHQCHHHGAPTPLGLPLRIGERISEPSR